MGSKSSEIVPIKQKKVKPYGLDLAPPCCRGRDTKRYMHVYYVLINNYKLRIAAVMNLIITAAC